MNRMVRIAKAPFLRNSGSVQSLMGDMLIVMPFLYAMPLFFFGLRIIKNMLISVTICYLSDVAVCRSKKGKFDFSDISSIVTAAIIPLLLPASVEFWIIIASDIFAIIFVKLPFGGLGNNPFNPAAAAFCFVAVSWPDKVFAYTKPLQRLNIFGTVLPELKIAETTASTLKNGGRPVVDVFDMLSGNVAGAAGVTSIIVILAAGGFLIYRHTASFQIPAGVLAGAAVIALLFPRISTGRLQSVWFELTSGALLFGSFFMATEPVTSPKHPYAKWIYGAAVGIITMLFRFFGKMEIAFPFALVIANSFTPILDKIGTGIDRYTDITSALTRGKRVKKEAESDE